MEEEEKGVEKADFYYFSVLDVVEEASLLQLLWYLTLSHIFRYATRLPPTRSSQPLKLHLLKCTLLFAFGEVQLADKLEHVEEFSDG